MFRQILRTRVSGVATRRILGAAFLAAGVAATMLVVTPAASASQQGASVAVADSQPTTDTKPAEALSLKGTCTFSGTKSTWSATLTRTGENVYDAVYVSSWSGKPLAYKGTIKSDLKTTISGDGVSTNKNGNGKFEFSGKFAEGGGAKCSYKEVGGGRSGSMTVDAPK